MRNNDLESAYWDSLNQMMESGLYSSEDEADMLKEQYKRIDEMARDEVINRVLEDAMKNLPGGGGSGNSSFDGSSGLNVKKPGGFVKAIVTALENAKVPATTAAALAPSLAPSLAAATSAGSTAIGFGPAGMIFGILASALPENQAADVTASLLGNKSILDTSSLGSAPSYAVKNGVKITSPDKAERESILNAIEDTQISIDEELLPRNFYSYSGRFPRAKSSEGFKEAKKQFRMAKGAELLNKKIDDVLSITGGPDPDDDKKKDKVLTEEKLREMAEQSLKEADDWFEQEFDEKFRAITSSKTELGKKITARDYDNYMEQAIKDIEKVNSDMLEASRIRQAEIAKYKATPEYAERLQNAAENFINSNISGKASPEAKARYNDYKLGQGERLIGANNLKAATNGRGTLAEKSARALEEAQNLQDWKDMLPSDLPKLDTSDLDATSFKNLRDGLADAADLLKETGTTYTPSGDIPGSKQMKIDTAIDILKSKE